MTSYANIPQLKKKKEEKKKYLSTGWNMLKRITGPTYDCANEQNNYAT